MVITLKNYRDLGRCSYGTLKEEFDSEKDEIFFKDKKIEINSIEDLFPFLWQSPGVSFTDKDGHSHSIFYSTGTHWHHDYDDSIEKCAKEIEKYQTKIAKNPSHKNMEKWMGNFRYEVERQQSLKRMLERLDKELEEQKKILIEENKV